uniref:Large ribosomal subunit protein mL40 n=1 Tax=Phasianus colchicus TaxID=9054 RepID=A0A669PE39_PHACC
RRAARRGEAQPHARSRTLPAAAARSSSERPAAAGAPRGHLPGPDGPRSHFAAPQRRPRGPGRRRRARRCPALPGTPARPAPPGPRHLPPSPLWLTQVGFRSFIVSRPGSPAGLRPRDPRAAPPGLPPRGRATERRSSAAAGQRRAALPAPSAARSRLSAAPCPGAARAAAAAARPHPPLSAPGGSRRTPELGAWQPPNRPGGKQPPPSPGVPPPRPPGGEIPRGPPLRPPGPGRAGPSAPCRAGGTGGGRGARRVTARGGPGGARGCGGAACAGRGVCGVGARPGSCTQPCWRPRGGSGRTRSGRGGGVRPRVRPFPPSGAPAAGPGRGSRPRFGFVAPNGPRREGRCVNSWAAFPEPRRDPAPRLGTDGCPPCGARAAGPFSLTLCLSSRSSRLPRPAPCRGSHWDTALLAGTASLPARAQPKKKKKVDPKREQAQKDRVKKKIKKLEKAAPELIPIEDFETPVKFSDSNRVRSLPPLSFEETERRVLLMKKWSLYKQQQDKAEKEAIRSLVEAQQEALQELRLESEELYQAAVRRDEELFPFERDGPDYTPALPGYDPPEGKCIDITKVYTQ